MLIILVMCIGIAVGKFLIPRKAKNINAKISLLCTLTLIFSMGAMLAARENFFGELMSLGIKSFLFFLFPTAFSVAVVFFMSGLMKKKDKNKKIEKVDFLSLSVVHKVIDKL